MVENKKIVVSLQIGSGIWYRVERCSFCNGLFVRRFPDKGFPSASKGLAPPDADFGSFERKKKNDINDVQMELFNPITRPKR
jgi:hypothetical protein